MKLKKISALGAGLAMAAAANAAAISFDDVPIRGNWEFSYTDYSVYGGEDVYEWSPSPSGSVESWQAMPANVGRFEWNSNNTRYFTATSPIQTGLRAKPRTRGPNIFLRCPKPASWFLTTSFR